MALNFSHRHLSEEKKVSPMRIANGYLVEGVSEKNWCSSIEKGDCFEYGNTGDSVSADILDILPSDPFGMDISNTFTAITGWLEDYNQYGRGETGIGDGNHQLFAGLSLFWNNAMWFQQFPGSGVYDNGLGSFRGFGGSFVGDGASVDNEDAMNGGEVGGSSRRGTNQGEDANVHPAFGFCLSHLEVKDLLSVSMVCKSLRMIVHDDPLLWKHIHIGQPLKEKITEEALLHLTERAQGTMQCLKLVGCSRITDDCLKQVMETNPGIVKLSVAGCTRLTIDGILSILRDLKFQGKLQVKHLEIDGLFGVTKDHYDEFFDLLEVANNAEQTVQKQRFYRRGDSRVSCSDDRALDIEMCPKCQNSKLVYDCPAEDCNGKEGSAECRGCSLCIQRCSECGRCINDIEYEETFYLDFLCSDCSKASTKLPL